MKKMLALLLCACMMVSLGVFQTSAASENLEIVSVVHLENYSRFTVEVTFSEPVVISDGTAAGGTPGVSETNNPFFFRVRNGLKTMGYGTLGSQIWGTTWCYANATQTKILVSVNDANIAAANHMWNRTGVNAAAPYDSYLAYNMSLCIEDNTAGWAGAPAVSSTGMIENIKAKDRNTYLVANTPGAAGAYDADYQYITEDTRPELTAVGVTMISDNTFEVEFSAPVSITGTPFMGIRMVNANNVVQRNEADTGYLQRYQGKDDWSFVEGSNNTKIQVTFTDADVVDMVNRTGEFDSDYCDALFVKFCIEENRKDDVIDTASNGMVDNFAKADGRMLTANMIANKANFDGLALDIVQDYREPDPDPDEDKLELLSATAITERQIVLEFSQPINIAHNPFMALRIVNENLGLQWTKKDDPDNPGTEINDKPMQFSGTWEYYNDEKTQVLWTASAMNILDVLNLEGDYAVWSDYFVKFCIEELDYTDKDNEANNVPVTRANGFIDNIKTTDGEMMMTASKPGVGVAYDASYIDVEIDLKEPEEDTTFRLVKATAVDKRRIVLEFSEPLKIVDGDPFMALRIVDNNLTLQWSKKADGSNDKPQQFYGTWVFAGGNKDKIVWTLNEEYGDINAILNRTGKYADYAGTGFKTMFCIEEMPSSKEDLVDGTISNVVSIAGGEQLLANKIGPGKAYDGFYLAVTVDPNYEIPATSTGMNPVLLVVGAFTAMAGMISVVVVKKRKQEN